MTLGCLEKSWEIQMQLRSTFLPMTDDIQMRHSMQTEQDQTGIQSNAKI